MALTGVTPVRPRISTIPTPNKNSGIVWNDAPFKEYIRNPQAKIPGTKMVFAGITNPQEVDDLWAYIKQFDPKGEVKK